MPTKPHWLKPWPWFWDPRKQRRPSREAQQASDDTQERLQRSELDAALAEEHYQHAEPVLDRLARLLERLGG